MSDDRLRTVIVTVFMSLALGVYFYDRQRSERRFDEALERWREAKERREEGL